MFIGHLGCETEMPSRCGGLPLRVVLPLTSSSNVTTRPIKQAYWFSLLHLFGHTKNGDNIADGTRTSTVRPQRGRTMPNRRSWPAVGVTMQGTTSKMSHNSTIILVVRPLWGRSHVDALPRRSRPAVMHSVTSPRSFLYSSLCHLRYHSQKNLAISFAFRSLIRTFAR